MIRCRTRPIPHGERLPDRHGRRGLQQRLDRRGDIVRRHATGIDTEHRRPTHFVDAPQDVVEQRPVAAEEAETVLARGALRRVPLVAAVDPLPQHGVGRVEPDDQVEVACPLLEHLVPPSFERCAAGDVLPLCFQAHQRVERTLVQQRHTALVLRSAAQESMPFRDVDEQLGLGPAQPRPRAQRPGQDRRDPREAVDDVAQVGWGPRVDEVPDPHVTLSPAQPPGQGRLARAGHAGDLDEARPLEGSPVPVGHDHSPSTERTVSNRQVPSSSSRRCSTRPSPR